MRILVVHNQLWAHYKSKLFSEIYLSLKENYPESSFKVAQIALYEASRMTMKDDATVTYDYPYEVLFEKSLDQVEFKERLVSLFRSYHRYRPTVLNITGYFDWAQVLLMIYARLRGVKVVLSSESSGSDKNRSPVKERLKSWIVNWANAYFCFGQTSVNYLLSLGVPESKISVRHAAVIDETVVSKTYQKAKLLNPDNSGKRSFVYVGRLASEKNLLTLLSAFRKISKEREDWGLLLVGDGPMRTEVENYVAKAGIQNVTFTGGIPWYQVSEWLAKSDVLILPSLSEPWGLVVNEAMVCGLPVIVSAKCGCAADLVLPGQNGFIFDPDNENELNERMQFFLQNPETISKMGEISQTIIRLFSSKLVARQMVDAYQRLNQY